MIKFRCKNCGQRLGVPEIHAGKKSKCPKCKNIFVVPQVRMPDSEPSDELTLLDVPEEYKVAEAPGGRDVVSDNIREDVRRLKQELGMEKEEPIAEHKLPWIIDIFLYPASKAGLITLGFIVGIPLLFKVVIQVFGAFTIMFPPLLVFLALFVFVSYTVRVILFLYLYWYFCECIRDSAIGGLRAPETMGITPVLGDMFWQLLRILACLVFFAAPALIYTSYVREADFIFWLLLGCGVLFFPMGLLAVVMFDSIRGLNPILLVGSIFSTFFQYFGLVVLFYGLGALVVLIASISKRWWILAYISGLVFIYLLIVAAHFLGRFFWKYEEKLNWEV